jgi:hypothetical protein
MAGMGKTRWPTADSTELTHRMNNTKNNNIIMERRF